MLDHGFTHYQPVTILEKGDKVGSVPVIGGTQMQVELIADEAFSYSLARDEKVQICLQEPGFVYAPVVEGQDAGFAYVCIGDTPVGKIPLRYAQTVEQEAEKAEKSLWEKFFGGTR